MYPLKSKSISNLNRHQHFYGCDDLAKYSNWLVFVFFALFLKISIVNPKFKAKIGSSPQHENMFIFEKSNHIYTKCMAGKNNLTEPSKKKKSQKPDLLFLACQWEKDKGQCLQRKSNLGQIQILN